MGAKVRALYMNGNDNKGTPDYISVHIWRCNVFKTRYHLKFDGLTNMELGLLRENQ